MKTTQTDRTIHHVHRWEEGELLKWPFKWKWPKQQINVIPVEIPMAFFTKLEQKILKSVWNYKTSRKNTLEKEQSWRYHTPRFQTILQSYSHQNSIVLVQKQTHRSMEQNREPRDETTLICGSSSTTREARIYNVEKTASLINGVGKTICEVRSLSRV